ncbi:MAG: S-adenosylmethionine:tRNA ribosyltransferase-isomerase, partial [Alphaproteobacteria bacterium]|nr:S-adenosylmethionine:tRNA ribosyltransferase-isomerase [Alphaproteobacteria bacterium]
MTDTQTHDWCLSDFDFDLPEERIAAFAVEPRDHARLLHVCGASLSDHHVFDLPDLLREGDVLVLNNTKVIPARLFGLRGEVKIEVMLNKEESIRGSAFGIQGKGKLPDIPFATEATPTPLPPSPPNADPRMPPPLFWSALARPAKRL